MHEGEIKFNFKMNFILCREQHACVLLEWKQICTRFLSFVYICIAVDMYDVGNPGPDLGQAQKCGSVKQLMR
jgi:hypothetical protein